MLKVEFEGTDGAGKTTGLTYFIEQARKRGLSVVETREVGNPNIPACVKMREFVLDPNSKLSGEAMELIFSAMRYENDRWLRQMVSPHANVQAPDLVVSDRGWYSHLAYTDHNVSPEFTDTLYKGVVEKGTLPPDVVLYFQVSTETALKRRIKRGTGMDVIEMKGIEFQNLVRDSFVKHMLDSQQSGSPTEIYLVDANSDIEGVRRQLDQILDTLATRAPVSR